MRVEGLAALERALQALPPEVALRTGRAAVRAGAAVLRDGAARRAPRQSPPDPAAGPGHPLAEHIAVGRVIAEGQALTVTVGPAKPAFHGLFLEFGTRHMAARPFLRPTIDEDGAAAIEALAQALDDGLQKAAARLVKGS